MRAVLRSDRDRLIQLHLQALAVLGWRLGPSDGLDQAASGALLDSDSAGFVSGRGPSTAARWAQFAEETGEPIAIKVGTAWLFVTARLLDYVERKFGLPARREGETRHRKLIEMRARSQQSAFNARGPAPSRVPAWDKSESKIGFDPDPSSGDRERQ